jgi:predicted DNA-binding protein (MmcQ/YjbR family)
MPEATCDFPFDGETEAFRVRGRIFALYFGAQAKPVEVNLKCDPQLARDLRISYPEVRPGWHMNHEHWNTVVFDGKLGDERLEWLVRHSWERVVAGLPRTARLELQKNDEKKATKKKTATRGPVARSGAGRGGRRRPPAAAG